MIRTEAWFSHHSNLDLEVRSLQERIRRMTPVQFEDVMRLARLSARLDPTLKPLKSVLLERLKEITDTLAEAGSPFGTWVPLPAWQAGVDEARDEVADMIASVTDMSNLEYRSRALSDIVRHMNQLSDRETAWYKLIRSRLPKGPK